MVDENKNVDLEMKKLREKKSPTIMEVQRLVRYYINVKKYDSEKIFEDLSHWNKEDVEKAIKEVERENSKPKPQRYYVSLKEPMDEF
ncbi:MAG: hypothetical protein QXE31_00115 [Candidatus Woesearchaeota archaeon]